METLVKRLLRSKLEQYVKDYTPDRLVDWEMRDIGSWRGVRTPERCLLATCDACALAAASRRFAAARRLFSPWRWRHAQSSSKAKYTRC